MALQLLRSSVALRGTARSIMRQFHLSSASHKIFDINKEEEFSEKVLSADVPVIVDFHADWCGPCRTLAPQLKEVVEKFEGKVDLAKVDVDQLPDLAMTHEVSSIPAVHAFVGGVRKSSFVGVQNKEFLTDFVKELIGT